MIKDRVTPANRILQKGRSDKMATRLDQEIEQLENIVEVHLDLCKVTWNGMRCTLPANHESTEPHKFQIESSTDADPAGSTRAFAEQERCHFEESDTVQK